MLKSREFFKKIIPILAVAFVLVGSLSLLAVDAQAQTSSSIEVGLAQANFTGQTNVDPLPVTAAKIIRTALGLLGIVAVVLVLYGGFVFMTAGGNEEKIDQGKKILINAGIGLIIILSAYGIVSFVLKSLVGPGTGGSDDFSNSGGTGDGGDDSNNAGFSQAFYVSSLPQNGQVCIKNIAPQIVFNKEVVLTTVHDAIIVTEKSTGARAPGSWGYGITKNIIVYTPSGTCAPGEGEDCFKAATDYSIEFKNASDIKSLTEPALSLNCRLKAGCVTVSFKSGDGVDRLPPTIEITYPENFAPTEAGAVVPVKMTYNDDNGVQAISLSSVKGAGRELINSVSFAGCKKSDTATINWTTPNNVAGNHVIEAIATDWAGQTGKATSNVSLKPNHCYNGLLETNLGEDRSGPPECGGECGACAPAACKVGNDCASGTCDKGICVEAMRITGFTPSSGAPGTFVTVNGRYFGTGTGAISFATKNNPDINEAADWVKAQLINCDRVSNNWSSGQVVVRVPVGAAASSHIKIESAPFIGVDGKQRINSDATTKHDGMVPFVVNDLIRPNICSISPSHGHIDTVVSVLGTGFGLAGLNGDKVTFAGEKVSIAPGQNNQPTWSDTRISVGVPVIGDGSVGVQVFKNNIESNSVRFIVESGGNLTAPLITEISPVQAPAGSYLTISGKNFGNKVGVVQFRATKDSAEIIGDTTFPKQCSATFWSDTKIMVKFPVGKGVVGTSYAVQVKTADAKSSTFDTDKNIVLEAGDPAPGVCAIIPASGPVPFPAGQTVEIFGDYFVSANNPTAAIYFWNPGAFNPTSITGRNPVEGAGVVKIAANSATVVPPVGTISGPVSVYRVGDTKMSNAVQFNAADCRENTSICGGTSHCCINGSEAGVCKQNGTLCNNETVSTGYIWRFATKSIPPVPHVVERCDALVGAGSALPSPSPSIAWDNNNVQGDQYKVCRTALITVELSTIIDPLTIKNDSVIVKRCSAINGNDCVNPAVVNLKEGSLQLKTAFANDKETHQYLSLQPTETWAPGSWYQVILTNKIKSLNETGKGVALAMDKPCGTDGAYCFTFKSDGSECQLKNVLVTPYSYYTQVLEAPIRSHTSNGIGNPIDYRAGGLSDQRCIMMDVSALPWKWETGNAQLAAIFGSNAGQTVNAEAKGNTVGINVPNDSVSVSAHTTITSASGQSVKSGDSSLTIDLSNPQVVDYWPKCLEACTNAAIGVRFNVSMSDHQLSYGSVQLLECNNESCSSTTKVSQALYKFKFTTESNGTELQISDALPTQKVLKPGQLYQVVISADSANPTTDDAVLWSRARSDDPSSFSKPLSKAVTWRFRTKKAECAIDRAEVLPKEFIARLVNDKAIYAVQPYSSPDACSAKGQKLNAWSVSWDWKTSDEKVASIKAFSSRGTNLYCTAACLRKGSDIPSTVVQQFPVCGNGTVEAGEDCDIGTSIDPIGPNKDLGCNLDCRWMGTTAPVCGNNKIDPGEACDGSIPGTVGCSAKCLHTGSSAKTAATDINASICGNGLGSDGKVGASEDCDVGIAGDIKNPKSALYCTSSCLHAGTTLSKAWCAKNSADFGKFSQEAYKAACAKAYSRCGDGIKSPDEDPTCDLGGGKHAAFCNEYCMVSSASKAATNVINNQTTQCSATQEGCSATLQLLGSSIDYKEPSVCGDEKVGTGEDAFCETELDITHDKVLNPWVVALAVSQGKAVGTPPKQVSTISAATDQKTKGGLITGSGLFSISCGYRNDNDCANANSGDAKYGVGENSCCFVRGKVTATVPSNESISVCRNTAIAASFDSVIDSNTLSGNILIAHGSSDGSSCPQGTIDVSNLIIPSASLEQVWYKRLATNAVRFIGSIFGSEVSALSQTFVPPSKWCAGAEQAAAVVVIDPINPNTSHLKVSLQQALATSSYYAVILKDGIKDVNGVHLNTAGGYNGAFTWKFETAAKICEVDAVTVTPSRWSFSKAKDTKVLEAVARSSGATGAVVQPIPGVYSWNYNWQPKDGDFVTLESATIASNKVTANNRNGEVDVRAFAAVVDNILTPNKGVLANGSSHVVVNLCENSWPPREVVASGGVGVLFPFPFSDTKGNASGFDLTAKLFNGSAIAPSSINTGVGYEGYFNFSTHYCADNGSTGTYDDLPYLQPAIQTTADRLKSDTGSCEVTGDVCKADKDCGTYYTGASSFVVANNANGICAGIKAGVITNYFDETADPIGCNAAADCTGVTNSGHSNWLSKNGYTSTCNILKDTKRALKCINNAPLKRFIFTSTNNSDAIGIQVFSNPEHLTPSQWYSNNKSAGGQGFVGTLKNVPAIGGYEAISDGNNIYVSALNYGTDKKNLFSDIYLFSINQNAKPETQSVFNQLIKNLRFNTNVPYNDGYCGTSMANPGTSVRCTSDLSCPSGQVCVNQVGKLKNNYQRYLDLKKIEGILDGYASQHNGSYPPVNVGSFLPGQTLSSWDWAGLASVVNQGLPRDPVEKLGVAGTCTKHNADGTNSSVGTFCVNDDGCKKSSGETCTIHNATTGWSTDDRRFSFACAADSYAYRYQVSSATGFTVLSHFEDAGLEIANKQNFVDGFHFNNVNRFKSITGEQNNICNKTGEISTISAGTCGDGQVNVAIGEQCDKPGTKEYGTQGTCTAGLVTVKTCSNECRWLPSACEATGKCGNGRIDYGEACDDGDPLQGGQNGKWNKCSKTCTLPSDPAVGYCGDGKPQTAFEVCDSGRLENVCVPQAPTCTTASECQNHEVCDGPKLCAVDNVMTTPNRVCSGISGCTGFLDQFQIALQPGLSASSPKPLNNDVILTTSRADVNNLVYDRDASSCDTSSQPYRCHVEFTYKTTATCDGRANFEVSLDRNRCVNGLCPTTAISLASAIVGPGCMAASELQMNNVTLVFKHHELSCKLAAGTLCRIEPDPNNCVNKTTCIPKPDDCSGTVRVDVGKPTYGITKAESCSWDCQSYGPYCGDGVVQSANGEECDFNAKDTLTCNVGGISGKKTCTSSCKLSDSASSAWWSLDINNGQTFTDRVGTADAVCQTENCPTFVSTGSVTNKGTFRFDGSDGLAAAHTDALMPTTVMSIEAWVKPEAGAGNYARVIEKGGYEMGGGYDLETNFRDGDAIVNRVAFNVWKTDGAVATKAGVYSNSELPLNQWTYVVATYEYQPTTKKESFKIYINGKTTPDNEIVRTNIAAPTLAKNTKAVTIGRGGAGGNFFIGSLNNVRVLNRVLQPSEIKNRFDNAWPCTIPAQSSVLAVAAGTCGDARVDPGEVCDLGVLQNGKQCTPGYGQTCQFCSADCKISQNLQANQFCGDGIIQGAEVCETDQATGDIFAKAQDAVGTAGSMTNGRNGYKVLQCNQETAGIGVFKKGTKVCSVDCKRIAVQENNSSVCIACGVNEVNGVGVIGNIVNVLDSTLRDPLRLHYNSAVHPAAIQLYISQKKIAQSNSYFPEGVTHDFSSLTYQLQYVKNGYYAPAPLNANQICSTGDSTVQKNYNITVNGSSKPFAFPIVENPSSWQYDLAVSPVIDSSISNSELRIVVSWVGETNFSAGFVRPSSPDNSLTVEDGSMSLQKATGETYRTKPRSDTAVNPWNIWYHGQGTTLGGLTEEAFTIDTNKMNDQKYMFYVRTAGASDYIRNFKTSARLKVDVYLPEIAGSVDYKIGSPARTFYLSGADVSSNQNSTYWHVFSINPQGATMADKIGNASLFNPSTDQQNYDYPNGRIVTGVGFMH